MSDAGRAGPGHGAAALAQDAAARGDAAAALSLWAAHRAALPGDLAGYLPAADVLRQAGRAAEATALLEEAARRLPPRFRLATALAEDARLRGDIALAEQRWRDILAAYPANAARATAGLARLLLRADRAAEAAALLAPAAARWPDDAPLIALCATAATALQDWPQAAALWSRALAAAPGRPSHVVSLVEALRAQDKLAEAEAVLAAAVARQATFPLLRLHAELAEARADWPVAVARWRAALALSPGHLGSKLRLVGALKREGGFAEADAILAGAVAADPASVKLRVLAASFATERGDWAEAVERWRWVVQNAPGVTRARVQLFEAQLRRLDPAGTEAEGEAPVYASERYVGTALTTEEEAAQASNRDLMMRFESLGDNCEFGLVQRRYGAEPLGLLRWSNSSLLSCARMFETDMAGIGDPDLTTVERKGGEYVVRVQHHRLVMHTFVREDQAQVERFHQQQCRRLRFLAQKLAQDVREGAKIFVYKTRRWDDPRPVLRLHAAMRALGPATLLYVRLMDDDHPNGTVEEIAPGLIIGYIDHISGAPWKIHHDSWLALCRNAAALADAATPAQPAALPA